MLRNREVRIFLIVLCSITLVAIIVATFYSTLAAILVFVTALLLIISSYIFTYWRYRELKKLSMYLRRISSGELTLDVRDNYEGELSILKNEIYKVTKKLSEQGMQLQQDKIHLTDAIADISHQLKTPLTSMVVMADLLSDPNLPAPKREEFTHKLNVQLERIEWLVSSLLKLSKIDAGTVHFAQEKVIVAEVVRKALEPMLIPIDIKEQSVTINGDEAATFVGDSHWVAEALLNILKNCVEHTPHQGKIDIRYSENALYTEIIISDNGKGIAKEDLPYIFKRFYKGKNASEDSVGIGLAMAHSIITHQNGTIDVHSEMDQGTQFHIKFYKQVI